MKFQSLQSDTDEQYYSGEEEPNDGGKDVVVTVGNYTQTLVLTNVIEDFFNERRACSITWLCKSF
jgi:hypothetical protein